MLVACLPDDASLPVAVRLELPNPASGRLQNWLRLTSFKVSITVLSASYCALTALASSEVRIIFSFKAFDSSSSLLKPDSRSLRILSLAWHLMRALLRCS